MEKKTTRRIIGALVVVALVIILMPLFNTNETQTGLQTAEIKAPPFPDSEIDNSPADNQSAATEAENDTPHTTRDWFNKVLTRHHASAEKPEPSKTIVLAQATIQPTISDEQTSADANSGNITPPKQDTLIANSADGEEDIEQGTLDNVTIKETADTTPSATDKPAAVATGTPPSTPATPQTIEAAQIQAQQLTQAEATLDEAKQIMQGGATQQPTVAKQQQMAATQAPAETKKPVIIQSSTPKIAAQQSTAESKIPQTATTQSPAVAAVKQPPVVTTQTQTVTTVKQPQVVTVQPQTITTAKQPQVITPQPVTVTTSMQPKAVTTTTVTTGKQPQIVTTQPTVTTSKQPQVVTTQPTVTTSKQPQVVTTQTTVTTSKQPPVVTTPSPTVATTPPQIAATPDQTSAPQQPQISITQPAVETKQPQVSTTQPETVSKLPQVSKTETVTKPLQTVATQSPTITKSPQLASAEPPQPKVAVATPQAKSKITKLTKAASPAKTVTANLGKQTHTASVKPAVIAAGAKLKKTLLHDNDNDTVTTEAIADNEIEQLKKSAWVVQMGSFKSKLNAERLTNSLRAKGYKAFTFETKSNGQTRVYIGPEFKQKAAVVTASRIQTDMKMHGIVLSFNPLEL